MSTGCKVESICLNVEAVNTHREKPEVCSDMVTCIEVCLAGLRCVAVSIEGSQVSEPLGRRSGSQYMIQNGRLRVEITHDDMDCKCITAGREVVELNCEIVIFSRWCCVPAVWRGQGCS